MKFIVRFLALIVALLFILTLPLSLLSFNVGRVLFNRELMKATLTDAVNESRLIPGALAWFSAEVSAELSLEDAAEDDLAAVLTALTQEGWQAIRGEVLTDAMLSGWVSASVDGFYTWLDSDEPVPQVMLEMQAFKTRVHSDFGSRAIEIAYNALPSCDSAQINDFEATLKAALPGIDVYYPPCRFPDLYKDDQLADYLNSLHEVVAAIPDRFDLSNPRGEIETQMPPVEGWQQLKDILRLFRSIYWMGLGISLMLFILLGLLAFHSLRSLARWGGIPLALAGMGGVLVSWTPNVFLRSFLSSGPLRETSPLLREEILLVLSRLVNEIFSPMMIQALVILLMGGLLIVFVGGVMIKQPPKKSRESVPPPVTNERES